MSKVALITGANGGIGQAIAMELAKLGYDIGINYIVNEKSAIALKADIEKLGRKAVLLYGDLTSSVECKNVVDRCIEELGSLYALVNNAGITRDTFVIRMTDDQFNDTITVNLNSCFYMTRSALPYLLKKRQGRIINISSVIGITGNAGQSNYAASKAGIIGFSKSCAKEAARRGICINVVAPGYIKTPMTDALDDTIIKEMSDKIPLKRLGEPKDVAGVVGFLCSDKASYITGQVIVVDGGMII